MSLERLIVSESKEVLKNKESNDGVCLKGIQEPTERPPMTKAGMI